MYHGCNYIVTQFFRCVSYNYVWQHFFVFVLPNTIHSVLFRMLHSELAGALVEYEAGLGRSANAKIFPCSQLSSGLSDNPSPHLGLFAWFRSDTDNKFQIPSREQIGAVKNAWSFGRIGVVLSLRTENLCSLSPNNEATHEETIE